MWTFSVIGAGCLAKWMTHAIAQHFSGQSEKSALTALSGVHERHAPNPFG
jgi:hypothetical protein